MPSDLISGMLVAWKWTLTARSACAIFLGTELNMVKQLTSTDSSVRETASRPLLSTVVILVCDDFMIFWYTGCPVFTVLLFSILDVPVFFYLAMLIICYITTNLNFGIY